MSTNQVAEGHCLRIDITTISAVCATHAALCATEIGVGAAWARSGEPEEDQVPHPDGSPRFPGLPPSHRVRILGVRAKGAVAAPEGVVQAMRGPTTAGTPTRTPSSASRSGPTSWPSSTPRTLRRPSSTTPSTRERLVQWVRSPTIGRHSSATTTVRSRGFQA